MDIYNLVSFVGLLVLVGIGWLLSVNRRRVSWRCVLTGVGLQLVFAALIFLAPLSRDAFVWVNDVVVSVINAAQAGQVFVFGSLADFNKSGFVLATQSLPLAIVFAALMSLLYYCGIMQRVIRLFARVFTRLMNASGAESLCASSNIFVGVESTMTIRPYLATMTRSELCTILTAGMATIASTVLAAYVFILQGQFPTIAGHLISASILSAPAAIVMSKLLVPEDGQPVTLGRDVQVHYDRESSAMESVINGAMAGVKLVVGIVALLVAFLGLLAIADLLLVWLSGAINWGVDAWCDRFSPDYAGNVHLSLKGILGYVMQPFAYLIGIPPDDAARAGELLGTRLVATEIPAYQDLAAWIASGQVSHGRTPVLMAYALCGFAHVASLAIFVGGTAVLVPERRRDLTSVGPRALLAATLACLMTAAVAGVFYHTSETVLRTSQP